MLPLFVTPPFLPNEHVGNVVASVLCMSVTSTHHLPSVSFFLPLFILLLSIISPQTRCQLPNRGVPRRLYSKETRKATEKERSHVQCYNLRPALHAKATTASMTVLGKVWVSDRRLPKLVILRSCIVWKVTCSNFGDG